MRKQNGKHGVALFVFLLISASLACQILPGGEAGDYSAEDLVATQTSLNATQQSLESLLEQVAGGTPGAEAEEAGPSGETDVSGAESGDVLVATEFDDIENWRLFALPEGAEFESSVGDSALYVEIPTRKTTVYAIYEPLYLAAGEADVRVEAGVETVLGPNSNHISLICRYSEDFGWYEFSMGADGLWQIRRYDVGEGYTEIYHGGSEAIYLKKKPNELAATCVGEEFAFYINGEETHTFRDDVLTEGQVGVSAASLKIEGVGVNFDWFSATIP